MNRRELLKIAAGSGTAAILSPSTASAEPQGASRDGPDSETDNNKIEIVVEIRD